MDEPNLCRCCGVAACLECSCANEINEEVKELTKQLTHTKTQLQDYEVRIAKQTAEATNMVPLINNLIQAADLGQKNGTYSLQHASVFWQSIQRIQEWITATTNGT